MYTIIAQKDYKNEVLTMYRLLIKDSIYTFNSTLKNTS